MKTIGKLKEITVSVEQICMLAINVRIFLNCNDGCAMNQGSCGNGLP